MSTAMRNQEAEMRQASRGGGAPDSHIRRLTSPDQALLRDHLLRLDPASRYERFGMAVNDEFLVRYASHCFDDGDLVFGYFVDDTLRGAGELRGLGQRAVDEAAEMAFSVEKDWRGQGVGSALLARLIETARNIGARTLYLTCLAQNRAMQKIVRGFQPQLRFEVDSATGRLVARGQPKPQAPSTESWRESFDDNAYCAELRLNDDSAASSP